jgi:hypothetical protein
VKTRGGDKRAAEQQPYEGSDQREARTGVRPGLCEETPQRQKPERHEQHGDQSGRQDHHQE